MNKYIVRIPYSYSRFGNLTCTVYAEDESDCIDAAYDNNNHHSQDYEDSDNDGDTDYEYSDMTVELDEEDVENPNSSSNNTNTNSPLFIPCLFIEELCLI